MINPWISCDQLHSDASLQDNFKCLLLFSEEHILLFLWHGFMRSSALKCLGLPKPQVILMNNWVSDERDYRDLFGWHAKSNRLLHQVANWSHRSAVTWHSDAWGALIMSTRSSPIPSPRATQQTIKQSPSWALRKHCTLSWTRVLRWIGRQVLTCKGPSIFK